MRTAEENGIPPWLRVSGIIVIVVVLLVVIMMLAGGAGHGPGRHFGHGLDRHPSSGGAGGNTQP